jgi:hypothetical protein
MKQGDHVKNLKETALKIFSAMFEGKEEVTIGDKAYPIETYSKSKVKHVDISNYRFIEQNPQKDSHWAEKARKGDQILWILKDWDYIGQVHDGKYKDFRESK